MKKVLISVALILIVGMIRSQETITYPHCNCTEIKHCTDADPKLLHGSYQLTCNNIVVESGAYKNGLKDSLWITKNPKGTIISKIEYSNGKLSGEYELFNYKGKPVVIAQFKDGLPVGEWRYLNSKGKVIKKGSYENGKPVGSWTFYDKKGKKVITEYDFEKRQYTVNNEYVNKEKSSVIQDDQSGEFIILFYLVDKNPLENTLPGGYERACVEFSDYLNLPIFMMNTHGTFHFQASIKIENGICKNIDVARIEKPRDKNAVMPFIVSTNFENKLKRVTHSIDNINYLKDRVYETLAILGPWFPKDDGVIKMHIPIVINDIKGF